MEWVSGNVFIRLMGDREGLKPGQVVAGHTHNFDHTSIFFCGRWRVKKWVPVVREPFGESVLSPVGLASAKPTPGSSLIQPDADPLLSSAREAFARHRGMLSRALAFIDGGTR